MAVAGDWRFRTADTVAGTFISSGKDLCHVDVADMRAFVIPPADVKPDAVLRQSLQSLAQGLDMGRGGLQELIVRKVRE